MSEPKVFYSNINSENLALDINEAARRLSIDRGYTNQLIEKCNANLKRTIECSGSWAQTSVKIKENEVDLGFVKVASRSLAKNLSGCESAFVFGVTLGTGVDRLIKKLSVTSVSEHFITDGLASAYAESACDYIEGIIKDGKSCFPRFSPGYGDLTLEIQKSVVNFISGGRLLNIRVGESLIMTPSKTITAIMGIKK